MENLSNPEPTKQTSFADFLRQKRSSIPRGSSNRRGRLSSATQDETALGIGISPASYRALEGSGPVNPTLDTLFRIQDHYSVPDSTFWGELVPSLRGRILRRDNV